jgi:hypothetical protein
MNSGPTTPRHHVDPKPAARPTAGRADSLAQRIHKYQQGHDEADPAGCMAILRMPERGGLSETEQGLEDQGARHCRHHDDSHHKNTQPNRRHTSLAQNKRRANSVWLIVNNSTQAIIGHKPFAP